MDVKEKLVYSSDEFEELSLPDIGYWLEHMIPKRGIVLLHGKYGAYKTAVALNLAHGISQGQNLWGLEAEKTKVLFLECDTPIQPLQQRARSLKFSGLSVDFAPLYPGLDVVNPKRDEWNAFRWDFLHKRHLAEPYGLVIVDSLRTIHSMSEKEGETAKEVYLSVATLFPDSTILLVHHDRKNYRDPNYNKFRSNEDEETSKESFMGSQRWIDLATTSLKISKIGKKTIRLAQTKSQWGAQSEAVILRASDDGVTLTPAALSAKDIEHFVTSNGTFRNRTQMYEALSEHFDFSTRWIRDKVTEYEKEHGRLM